MTNRFFTKWFVTTIWIGLFISFVSLFVALFWLLYPYKILSFGEGNATFIESTVKRGELLQMKQNNCKYMEIQSEISRQFIDGIIYQVPDYTANRPVGCYTNVEYVDVPKQLPAGQYKIRTVIHFHPNPIRTINYVVVSESFTVTN